MATLGGAPKNKFFYENALSGSIHSTYQLPSLQTDQNPTLGQPMTHIVCMENFDLHELIETSVLHEMILCVSEGLLSSLF